MIYECKWKCCSVCIVAILQKKGKKRKRKKMGNLINWKDLGGLILCSFVPERSTL